MKTIEHYYVVVFLIIFSISSPLKAQTDISAIPLDNFEQNNNCLKCHGHSMYFYYNESVDRTIKERMNPYFIFDSIEYYNSNHKSFICTDCHSMDYLHFPHDGLLRMEPKFGCLDCHAGDDQYAKYNFESIDEEFKKSVHSSKHIDDFTCSMCHNPHTYRINARTNEHMADFILYDNEICLSCHADVSKYQLLTTAENPNVLETHDWLPNQILHFKKVRCIECHTSLNDEILVSHDVRPKEMAIKLCVECHSRDSRLLASLYKFQFSDARSITGFSNKALLQDNYVIGANRNVYLNYISVSIFLLVLGGILIHVLLRIFYK